MIIHKATTSNVEAVHALLERCGNAMAREGFHNWNPPVGIDVVRASAVAGDLFIVEKDGVLVGTITLLADGTVKRLAVEPEQQHAGLGATITRWAEEYARSLGHTEIQLDALADNERLVEYYERAGYQKDFEHERDGWRFVRMKKRLKPQADAPLPGSVSSIE